MLRALLTCLAALAVAACTPDVPNGVFACRYDNDCPTGFVCRHATADNKSPLYCFDSGASDTGRALADGGVLLADGAVVSQAGEGGTGAAGIGGSSGSGGAGNGGTAGVATSCADLRCQAPAVCDGRSGAAVCACPPPFWESNGSSGCRDIDECLVNNGGCPDGQTCINNAGAMPSCELPRCVLGSSRLPCILQ